MLFVELKTLATFIRNNFFNDLLIGLNKSELIWFKFQYLVYHIRPVFVIQLNKNKKSIVQSLT